jgi:electron transfer flavoprotein alpha/beta subunit
LSVIAILEVTADPLNMRYDLQKEALEGLVPVISRCDLTVLEKGKKLAKERGTELTVIVVGEEMDEALYSTLSLVGANRAVLVSTPHSAMEAPLQRVMQLSLLIQKYSPQIVLCNERQSDGFHSFTGGWLAELLNFAHMGGVEKMACVADPAQVMVETVYQKGYKGTFLVTLPAVFSLSRHETVSYVPRLSRVHLIGRQIPLEKVAFSLEERQVKDRTIVFERLSEVKPRTKASPAPVKETAPAGGLSRGNPLAARMKMMMGGPRAEKKEQSTKEVVADSPKKAAELLLKKLEEWRKER